MYQYLFCPCQGGPSSESGVMGRVDNFCSRSKFALSNLHISEINQLLLVKKSPVINSMIQMMIRKVIFIHDVACIKKSENFLKVLYYSQAYTEHDFSVSHKLQFWRDIYKNDILEAIAYGEPLLLNKSLENKKLFWLLHYQWSGLGVNRDIYQYYCHHCLVDYLLSAPILETKSRWDFFLNKRRIMHDAELRIPFIFPTNWSILGVVIDES